MKLSKKQLIALICVVLVLGVSNVAFALLYMSRNVDITGGVETVGSIEVYDTDGVTIMTFYGFFNFTGGVEEISYKEFFINNTGNQPLDVSWNISSSSLTWGVGSDFYTAWEISDKYYFGIQAIWITEATTEYFGSIGSSQPPMHIPVGEGKHLRFYLHYTGTPNTAETFTLRTTFYAEDS